MHVVCLSSMLFDDRSEVDEIGRGRTVGEVKRQCFETRPSLLNPVSGRLKDTSYATCYIHFIVLIM